MWKAWIFSPLYEQIKAVERGAGRSANDPRIFFALWLYATLRGVGSARELARRCDPRTGEIPFQWMCGGVSVNYHSLADFRTEHVELLDATLTNSVAVLMQERLVTLDRVAQDGMKVRASAGAASFRRRETLEDHLAQAKEQIETLKQELDADPGAASRRQQAARERAARERAERLSEALRPHSSSTQWNPLLNPYSHNPWYRKWGHPTCNSFEVALF